MKSSEIKVGGLYAYVDNPGSRYRGTPTKVEVLEVGADRRSLSRPYYVKNKIRTDGIRVKVVDHDYEFVARPAQIISTWEVVEAQRGAQAAHEAEADRKRAEAVVINRPVLEAVRAVLRERGIDPEHHSWRQVMEDEGYVHQIQYHSDGFASGSHSVSLSLTLADLAQLLGVEGKVVGPYEVDA